MQIHFTLKYFTLASFSFLILTSCWSKQFVVEGHWEIQSLRCESSELSKSGKSYQNSILNGDYRQTLKFNSSVLSSNTLVRPAPQGGYCKVESKQVVLIKENKIKRSYLEWELKHAYKFSREECKKSLNPSEIAVPKKYLQYLVDDTGRLVMSHPLEDRRSQAFCVDGAPQSLYVKIPPTNPSPKELEFHTGLKWMKEPIAKGTLIYKDKFKDLIHELFGKLKARIHPHTDTDTLAESYFIQSSMPDMSIWMPSDSTLILPRCRRQSCQEKSWLWLNTRQKIGALALIHYFDSDQKVARKPNLLLALSEGNCSGIAKDILILIRDWLVISRNQNIRNFQCVGPTNRIVNLDTAMIKYD